MKKTRLLLILAAVLSAPFLVTAAVNKIATLPPYDGVADIGKTPTIKADGSGLQWSVATGVSGNLAASGAVVNNNLASWAGTTGKAIKDSGVPSANVVLVSRAVQAGTGLTVTNSGLLSSDITMSLASQAPMSVLGVTGATGSPTAIAATGTAAQILFANYPTSPNMSWVPYTTAVPLTTKGDLFSYGTQVNRQAIGSTGAVLTVDNTQTNGMQWLTQSYAVFGLTSAQAITNATWQNIGWTTTYTSDPSGNITITSNGAGTASTRVRSAAAGLFNICVTMAFVANSTGTRVVSLETNSNGTQGATGALQSSIGPVATPVNGNVGICRILRLAAGEYAEVFVYQSSGGSLNAIQTANGSVLQIARIGL